MIDIQAELGTYSEKLIDVSIYLNHSNPLTLSEGEKVLANQLALHQCRLAIGLRASQSSFDSLSDLVFQSGSALYRSLEHKELLPEWAQILENPIVQNVPHWKYQVLEGTMSIPELRLKHILEALALELPKDYKMYREGLLMCALDGSIPLSQPEAEKLALVLLTESWDARSINVKLKIKDKARKILKSK